VITSMTMRHNSCSEQLAGPISAGIALARGPILTQKTTVMGSQKRGGPAVALTATTRAYRVKGGPLFTTQTTVAGQDPATY